MKQNNEKVLACKKFLPLFAVLLFFLALISAAQAGDVNEECKKCHDVKSYQQELDKSSHAVDKDKKPIKCDQCHVLHYYPMESYAGRDDYDIIFKPEDLNRRKMQIHARQRAIPPEKCSECHKDLNKNVKGETLSEIGQLSHEAFLGKNGSTRRTCAGCHINMAHLPDFDRRLAVNAEFAKRLPPSGVVSLPTYPHKDRAAELAGSPMKHLLAPDSAAACYECHKKATPKVAQDWYESKHGLQLMKCFVCHGEPDGKGSVPYRVNPDAASVCMKCHDPAMKRMQAKYGMELQCTGCHPFHQNSLHHKAYEKSESKKTAQ